MAKVLFVDDRLNEVMYQWECSGCASGHQLLVLEKFDYVKQTCENVKSLQPDVVLIGYGLGKGVDITGADVVNSLREMGYKGRIVANSGGGVSSFVQKGVTVDGYADRRGDLLRTILDNIK